MPRISPESPVLDRVSLAFSCDLEIHLYPNTQKAHVISRWPDGSIDKIVQTTMEEVHKQLESLVGGEG